MIVALLRFGPKYWMLLITYFKSPIQARSARISEFSSGFIFFMVAGSVSLKIFSSSFLTDFGYFSC